MCVRANLDIIIAEGGTYNQIFQWASGDPAVNVDLTGYTAHMKIRAKLKDTTPLVTLDHKDVEWAPEADSGIYFFTDEYGTEDDGRWRVYIKDEDTEGLCAAHKNIVGVYDLFLYNPSGEAVFQLYGTATIYAAVTRDDG